jgi:hypothetical protein
VHFDLYKDFWVLASQGRDEDGIIVDLPPVRVIPRFDVKALKETINVLLEEPVRRGARLASDDVGLRARAVGAKSWPAFVRSARAFDLQLSPSKLVIEEWRTQGRTFVAADPVWRIECRPNELEEALQQLLRHAASP